MVGLIAQVIFFPVTIASYIAKILSLIGNEPLQIYVTLAISLFIAYKYLSTDKIRANKSLITGIIGTLLFYLIILSTRVSVG